VPDEVILGATTDGRSANAFLPFRFVGSYAAIF
jgi:hypothetical protein